VHIAGNYSSIKLRTLHLEDVYLNLFLGDLLELFLQFVNFLSALADNDTGACSMTVTVISLRVRSMTIFEDWLLRAWHSGIP